MKRCNKCNKEFSDEFSYCTECGEKLDGVNNEDAKTSLELLKKEKEELKKEHEKVLNEITNKKKNIEEEKRELEKRLEEERKNLLLEKEKIEEEKRKLEREKEILEQKRKENEKTAQEKVEIEIPKEEAVKSDNVKKKISPKKLVAGILVIVAVLAAGVYIGSRNNDNVEEVEYTEVEENNDSNDGNNNDADNDEEENSEADVDKAEAEQEAVNPFGKAVVSKDKKLSICVRSVKDVTKKVDKDTKEALEENHNGKVKQYLLVTYSYKNIDIGEKIIILPTTISDEEGSVYQPEGSVFGYKMPVEVGKGKKEKDAQTLVLIDEPISGKVGVEFSEYYGDQNYEFNFEGEITK